MKYCSTRGGVRDLTFTDSLLMGLAPDGGLLVPQEIPDVSGQLVEWQNLGFVEFAQEIVAIFASDIDRNVIDELVSKAYSSFAVDDVIGWQTLGDLSVVELFHGPTLAFKDVALQLVGQLFEYVLNQQNRRLNILGATSGDTGSAAIAGVRGQSNVDIFILYPDQKVSPLQELQMTTVPDANVHCIAVQGSFDDCQGLMKGIFEDLEFKDEYSLGAVNSVNWARIMAQIVYYGYASLKLRAMKQQEPSFCVPTGNFGNVFAGYLAKRMGFPIDKLLVATNENDILARFFDSGQYARGEVHYTMAPAMDIQVASNFERYLYYLVGQDGQKLQQFMQTFLAGGEACLNLTEAGVNQVPDFLATAIDTAQVLQTIKDVHARYDYILDPHTAIGVAAALKFQASGETSGPIACVATAHPAKFPDAVEQAIPGEHVTHPSLESLKGLAQRKQTIDANADAVKAVIRNALN